MAINRWSQWQDIANCIELDISVVQIREVDSIFYKITEIHVLRALSLVHRCV